MTTHPHFAIGLVVDVREGAKPVGWNDATGRFDEQVPTYRSIESVDTDGNVEVGGWFWAPTDVSVR